MSEILKLEFCLLTQHWLKTKWRMSHLLISLTSDTLRIREAPWWIWSLLPHWRAWGDAWGCRSLIPGDLTKIMTTPWLGIWCHLWAAMSTRVCLRLFWRVNDFLSHLTWSSFGTTGILTPFVVTLAVILNNPSRLSMNFCENSIMTWPDLRSLMILPRNSTRWLGVR